MIPGINISALFAPRSVAVIGASRRPDRVGHMVVANLIEAGFPGDIYPVNPHGGALLGLPVLASVEALPHVDLAVIAVPAAEAVAAMEALAARGLRAAVVLSAGFKETGAAGAALERRLAATCEAHGIAMVGPNCLGLISTRDHTNASFAIGQPQTGRIAFFSQSGALCAAILDRALGLGMGFSKFVSLGNKAAFNEAHMLAHLRDDAATAVVLGYLEDVEDGPEFLARAAEISRAKPVVLIKAGATAAGAKAAASHTGAIAGSDAAYDAAFRKAGVIRARDVASLFDLALAFASQPLPHGPGIAIVTNSGGPGIMAADAVERSRLLSLARLEPATVERLKACLPPCASVLNPVDIIGDAPAARYREALQIVAADANADSLLVLLTPTAATEIEATAQAVIDVAKGADKPVLAAFMGGLRTGPGERMLNAAGVPCYLYPEPPVACLETMYAARLWRQRPPPDYPVVARDRGRARRAIDAARAAGATEVVEFQAQDVLHAYGLPAPRTVLAATAAEATEAAARIGYPVALKIASPDISHKSDVDGVKVGLATAAAVETAYAEIVYRARRQRPEARIAGCLVQEMGPCGGHEVIVGFRRDPRFGPLLMFGLGGVHVEILKDVAFRLAPLDRDEARAMIREIRGFRLLEGVRGAPPANLQAIEAILAAMAQFALDFPEVREAECNPVLVDSDRAMVADIRLVLDPVREPAAV